MRWRAFVVSCLLVAGATLLFGCGEESPAPVPSSPQPESRAIEQAEEVVKSMEEYREEAAAEIDADDAEAELKRLEAEIEADIETGE